MLGNMRLRTFARATGLLLLMALLAWSPTAMPEPAAAEDPVGVEEPPSSEAPAPSTEPAPSEEPPPPYRPQPGPVFNNPAGTSAERLAINNHLVAAINNAPRGATIRIAMFSGSIPSFRDAVIAAYRRGVNVRLIMDGHASGFEWWKSMVRVLGTDRSRPSFATVCRYSCFDTRVTTLQHSKLYLFTRTGAATRVTMLGSGNPTYAQANTGWNDLFTLVRGQSHV